MERLTMSLCTLIRAERELFMPRFQDAREVEVTLKFPCCVKPPRSLLVYTEYEDWVDRCVDDPQLAGIALTSESEWKGQGNEFVFTVRTLWIDEDLEQYIATFRDALSRRLNLPIVIELAVLSHAAD